jgi:hypothetical protein
MRVLRLSLVAATAVIAAACGDKVNVVGPSNTAGKIQSVLVAPSSATISVGQTVTLTAAVNVDNGVTATVAWSTSSAAAASLSGSSNTSTTVTGVASSPGVAICATASATGVANVENCATVVVQPVATVVPATIQITSVTGANLNTPVNVPPGTINGQINVSVTANPGTEKLDSVVVLLNGKNAGTQTFTAAQAAALRSAGNAAVAGQQVLAPLVFSINTGAYNTTTGAVTFPNGNVTLSAVAYGHQGSSAASNVASQGLSYILGNADAWAITQSLSSTLVANNAAGFNFNTGAVTINAVPVLYSGLAIASANVNFGTAACDLSGGPQRTQALTAPAAGTFAWTAVFAKTSATTAGTATDVNSYEYNTACASNAAGGEGAVITSSNYTNSSVGPTGISAGIANPVVRLDNRAPAAPVANLNPNGRANSWVNDAVVFNGVATSSAAALAGAGAGVTSNGMVCNNLSGFAQGNCAVGAIAPADAGVGGVVFSGRVGATIAAAGTATAITNATTLAPSATNATYCLALYSSDALGNTSKTPAACTTTFGVDRVAPVISVDATSIANNSRFAVLPASEFVLAVVDTGLVGNSGMLPVAPVTGTVAMRGASTTAAAACYIGTFATATGCSAVTLNSLGAGKYNTGVGATMATAAGPDYYTFNATATDAAGNSSVSTAMVTVVDQTGPVVGAAAAALTVTPGFSVNAFVNEDLDIQSQWFSVDYATATIAPTRIGQVPTPVNGYNAAAFINTNFAISQVITSPFELQANAAATLYPLSGVEANAMSQSNLISTGTATAPGFTAPTAISIVNLTAFTTPTNSIASNTISSGVTTAATTANPAAGTLTVTTTGTTAIFNNPFSRVDFYAVNKAGTEYRLIGSTTASALTDNGAVRTFTYQVGINGLALYNTLGFTATAATNVIAIGFNAAGTVGMFTGAYALTIVK